MVENQKVCPFCELVFNEDKIKDHIGSKHLGIPTINGNIIKEEKKHICEKDFLCEASLQKHQKFLHPKRNRFACDICRKSYNKRYNLKMHKHISHEGKRYSCETCGKAFTKPSIL